ncbi:MAG TPA: TraR/DksA C4-type zinc finger protein [Aromatoleum sp.]|uniref:TraR/DksA family transcriptional regulator n=1 Tax=Aromatoleum sp. TaxID=2307007 RepID=UPI002B467D62|nr:TraR/DksA C4-type zinc finger protein [Aromatoleum sp.]HJV24714.1 TraR/DksA C4-type zinc finger protein [Aromatoleum sp.]
MPITPAQVAQLRAAMERRREQLFDEIALVRSRADENPAKEAFGVADVGDESVASHQTDVDNAAVERDAREVRDIDAALVRMDDGSYGTCIDCGQDIDPARLSVSPTSIRCTPCQERYEQTYGSGAASSL